MLFNDIPGCGDIKPIGFGPNILSYSTRRRTNRGNISLLLHKVYSKLVSLKVISPKNSNQYVKSIANAINLGFHIIDFSASYGNQDLVGKAIKQSKVSREALFVTTRISNKAQRDKTVREEFLKSLHDLGLDYVDLLQIHWPVPDCYLDTWREMEKLKDEGLVKHLGTANCHQHHIEAILKICKYKPEICQFEIHPLFTQKPLIQYYQDKGIVIEAYTPVARCDDRLVKLPLLKRIADKYGKSVIQIVLRWHIQNGIIPIVRAMSNEHQLENIDVFDFELTSDEMKAIDGININSRLRFDPDNCDFSIL